MHQHECAALADYITQSDDPLTMIVKTTPTPVQHHIMKHLNHHQGSMSKITATSWTVLCPAGQNTTGGRRPVSLIADQGALEGQDRSSPVCSDGANIGDKMD
eukprot:9611311-Ditylum_brightwellii.AAC.2